MTAERDNTKRINTKALRSLHALERLLNRHAHDLMAIDCEDADAAEAILFAVQQVERARDNARAVRRRIHNGGPTPADDQETRAGH